MNSSFRFLAFLVSLAMLPASAADLAVMADPAPVRLGAGETLRFQLQSREARRLEIILRDLAFEPPSVAGVALRVHKGDGTSAGADWTHCSIARMRPACIVELSAEAQTRYVIDVEAPFSAAARFTLAASGMAAWPAAGTPLAATPPLAAKDVQRFGIEVKAGENVTIGLADIAHEPDSGRMPTYLALLDPDGTQRAGAPCSPGPRICKLSLAGVPPGAYTVLVRPAPGSRLTAKPHRGVDAVMKVGDDGVAEVRITKPGQLLRLEFAAQAGESFTATVSNIRREGPAELRLLRPDGSQVAWRMVMPADTSTTLGPFKATTSGAHTLAIDPGFSTLSATVTVKR
jgi:hypothetical protein